MLFIIFVIPLTTTRWQYIAAREVWTKKALEVQENLYFPVKFGFSLLKTLGYYFTFTFFLRQESCYITRTGIKLAI